MANLYPHKTIVRAVKERSYPIPDIDGPRWHLVDRRRVKADIKEAAQTVHLTREEFKQSQRDNGCVPRELQMRLEGEQKRSRILTTFASWLNGTVSRPTVAISDHALYSMLDYYRIEAITALAALVRDEEDA